LTPDDNQNGTRIQNLENRSLEVKDLYRKLFADRRAIGIENLTDWPGFPGLTQVLPDVELGTPTAVIVQCGDRSLMRLILKNWKEYYEKYIEQHSAHLKDYSETLHFASIAYTLNGISEDYDNFSIYFRHNPPEQIASLLNRLFESVLEPWYSGNLRITHDSQMNWYRKKLSFDKKRETIEKAFSSTMERHPLAKREPKSSKYIFHLKDNHNQFHFLPDPLLKIFDNENNESLRMEMPTCLLHGNLTGETFRVSNVDQFWMSVGAEAGPGFYLHDFASLESDIFLNLTRTLDEEKTVLALRAWLSPSTLDERFPMDDRIPEEYKKTFVILETVRRLAARMVKGEIYDYYLALLFLACNRVLTLFGQRGERGRSAATATLAAAFIGHRLDFWPNWEDFSLFKQEISWKLEQNKQHVFQPHSDRWIQLHHREFDLMKLFIENPEGLITHEEIEAIWGVGTIVTPAMKNKLISRLHTSIRTGSPEQKYIKNIRNNGYVFYPNGIQR
jgi:hypothetical protein